MNQEISKNFYVRRRDKTYGPFTTDQISRGKAAKKFLETDLIAVSLAGPWISISDHFAALSSQAVDSNVVSPELPPKLPPTVNYSESKVAPEVIDAILVTQPSAAPSSTWKYAVLGVVGVIGAGFIGLRVLLFVAAIVFSSSEPQVKPSVSSVSANLESGNPYQEVAQGASESSNDETGSGDALTQALLELKTQLERLDSNPSVSQEETASKAAPAGTYAELSAEQKALSPAAATELAIKFLDESERATNGRIGVQLMHQAANAGDDLAMYNLFIIFLNGYCVEIDKPTALNWLQKSAEAGRPEGMYAYSVAIQDGHFEGMGNSERLMWLNRSAQVGHQPAIDELNGAKVQAIAGLFGAALGSFGSQQGTSNGRSACTAISGFFNDKACSCSGFNFFPQGTGSWETCYNCGHSKADHNW